MNGKILFSSMSIGIISISGCANLYPPQAEKEITLKMALLDTVDSLSSMKAKLNSSGQHLNMFADQITAEFYVKGARVQNSAIEATATIPNLVIKPSYSLNDSGERSNKITIIFKNIANLASGGGESGGGKSAAGGGKGSAESPKDVVDKCLSDPNCISAMKERLDKM